jgi:hypothetical protein
MAKISKRSVDALTLEEKPFVEYDADLAGFRVRVMPTGVMSIAHSLEDRLAKLPTIIPPEVQSEGVSLEAFCGKGPTPPRWGA